MAASIPGRTEVLIAGGGPVGLAAAVELGSRGIDCVVVEPRSTVSHARPRCKTVNVRTMEHLRRWGVADRFRERAPLPVSWSSDVVFCTSLAGRELSRFTGVLGLDPGGLSAEPGQQAPQYVLEELLRDVVDATPSCRLVTGASVAGVEQDEDAARVTVVDPDGSRQVVRAEYVLGCDGPRSAVRGAVGSAYVGGQALRPNYGMVFRAPGLWDEVRHGPAVQFWTVNADAPALMGPIDRGGTWWIIAFGVEEADGRARGREIVDAAAGVRTGAEILSTDPWTARMMLVDRARTGRVFLAGDAAHLNPPFGGHGLNTGVGDAVDLGWKLAAVLRGWGGPGLLDSYEAERRPVQDRVIREAEANMRTLSADLVGADLDRDGPAGDRARRAVHERIQATKHAEFHALDLVLDVSYEDSPIVAGPGAGARLGHRWLDDGRALHDVLGPGFTLLTPGDPDPSALDAARAAGVPLTVRRSPLDRYLLVRPDQHVAWIGDEPPADPRALFDHVRGAAPAHRDDHRAEAGAHRRDPGGDMSTDRRDGPIIPPKLHHATFLTLKLDEMVRWYGLVAGLTPVHYSDAAAWLTNDAANHRIALISHPAIKRAVDKPTSAGLHHTAFEYERFDQWLDNYVRLRGTGIVPFMCLDHGITMSMYYADPEGNGVEIQFDAFGDWAVSKEWMWAAREFAENPIGEWFDPDQLVDAREQGLSVQEIHDGARSGKYRPENPPSDLLLPEVW